MEVLFVGVRKRAEAQIPLISIGAVEFEVGVGFLGSLEQRGILESVAEAEGSVVMEVVAQEHVGGRGLLRGGLERRVRIEQGHGGEPAAVRNSQNADAAVRTLQ